jgi:predicted enzyme related to lactoylglutathione lyase
MSPMTTTITATRVSTSPMYVVLRAESLERARSFYQEKVGIELKELPGGLMGMTGSGSGLFIYESPLPTPQNTVGVFVVPSVEEAVSELKSHGVVFETYPELPGSTWAGEIAEMGGTKAAWFTDSEGNILNVVQM